MKGSSPAICNQQLEAAIYRSRREQLLKSMQLNELSIHPCQTPDTYIFFYYVVKEWEYLQEKMNPYEITITDIMILI